MISGFGDPGTAFWYSHNLPKLADLFSWDPGVTFAAGPFGAGFPWVDD